MIGQIHHMRLCVSTLSRRGRGMVTDTAQRERQRKAATETTPWKSDKMSDSRKQVKFGCISITLTIQRQSVQGENII